MLYSLGVVLFVGLSDLYLLPGAEGSWPHGKGKRAGSEPSFASSETPSVLRSSHSVAWAAQSTADAVLRNSKATALGSSRAFSPLTAGGSNASLHSQRQQQDRLSPMPSTWQVKLFLQCVDIAILCSTVLQFTSYPVSTSVTHDYVFRCYTVTRSRWDGAVETHVICFYFNLQVLQELVAMSKTANVQTIAGSSSHSTRRLLNSHKSSSPPWTSTEEHLLQGFLSTQVPPNCMRNTCALCN